jgi:hypothetical protein
MLKAWLCRILVLLASAQVAGASPPQHAAGAQSTSAATAPILDVARLPRLPTAGQTDYARFLLQATPRAFALSTDGSWGWAAAQESLDVAERKAVAICNRGSSTNGCKIYARDLDLVWPGRESPSPRVLEVAVAGGQGWTLFSDWRFLWHGPARARGAYVWAHGRAAGGQDSRWTQPQPHVRAFNNTGYDIIRFDRAPATDETDAAADWLRQAIRDLRASGYARIVVGGQSRGAWNALQALAEPDLVDAVVAIAPAAHGARGSPAWAWALDDLRSVVQGANSPAARVVVASFAEDEFDPDPDGRGAMFRSLGGQVGAMLFIDRPPEIVGHAAGADSRFTLRYAPCILEFVEGRRLDCP